jgi:ribosomal protein S27AE
MDVKGNVVKLGDGEMQLFREIREYLIRYGISSLDDLTPICPKCGNPLNARITAEYWKCEKCGYSQKGIYTGRGITTSFIVGAGLVALLRWLKRGDEYRK